MGRLLTQPTGSPACPGPPPPLLPTLAPHGTPSVSRKPATSPVLKRLKLLPLNILRRKNSLHNMCRAPRKVFRASPHRDPCSVGLPVMGPTDTAVQSGAQKLQQERRPQRVLLSAGASAPRTRAPHTILVLPRAGPPGTEYNHWGSTTVLLNRHHSQLITGTDCCFPRSQRHLLPPRAPVPRNSRRRRAPKEAQGPLAKCNSVCRTRRWLLSEPGSTIPPACPASRLRAPLLPPRCAPSSPASLQAARSWRGSLTRGRAAWPGWLRAHHSAKAWRHKGWVGAVKVKGVSEVRRNAVHRIVS